MYIYILSISKLHVLGCIRNINERDIQVTREEDEAAPWHEGQTVEGQLQAFESSTNMKGPYGNHKRPSTLGDEQFEYHCCHVTIYICVEMINYKSLTHPLAHCAFTPDNRRL